MRLPYLHGNIRQIHVKNCVTLHVAQNSLTDLPELNSLTFEDINELTFESYALNSTRVRPAIRFQILKSSVLVLPSHLFKGNLEDLLIKDSDISKIEAFAFTGIFNEISSVKIVNSTIKEVDPQAFKKLTIRSLDISDSKFQMNLPSRTFYDCHIRDIFIENCYFSLLNPSTVDVKEVQRLTVLNSTFGIIEGEAFMMDVSDRAIFSNNNVTMLHQSAFKGKSFILRLPCKLINLFLEGITMHPKSPNTRTQEVFFELNNNHIDFVHPERDISFCPNMKLQISKLYLRDSRNCEALRRIYEEKFFYDNSNSVFMRTNEDEQFETISYLNDRCKTDSKLFLLIIIFSSIFVLLLILVLVIFAYIRHKRKLHIMILPEPRTYKQTQIIMKVETHGLIKTDF